MYRRTRSTPSKLSSINPSHMLPLVKDKTRKQKCRNIIILFCFFALLCVFSLHLGDQSLVANKSFTKAQEFTVETSSPISNDNVQMQPNNKDLRITKIDATTLSSSTKRTYPSPLSKAHPDAKIYVQPILGKHRPRKDAVFGFAENYPLETYVQFLSSLRNTEYNGDVVLSCSSVSKMKPNVFKYLESQVLLDDAFNDDKMAVIVYAIDWKCFKRDGITPIPDVQSGFSHCTTNLYGKENEQGELTPINDPREKRPVATARYEVYWIWSTMYQRESRILLVDVRDTFFQANPFQFIPKLSKNSNGAEAGGGLLHLFGENYEATSISGSSYNRRWIQMAYGDSKLKEIADKPVICSGSTMGDAIAIESYLRIMVTQFDDTKCKATGCDQGFHNYIHYYHFLESARGIDQIIVFPQGQGVINNLAAMRTKPLAEWGILQSDTNLVLNWDGSISPVVHQFDRDVELKNIIKAKVSNAMKDLKLK